MKLNLDLTTLRAALDQMGAKPVEIHLGAVLPPRDPIDRALVEGIEIAPEEVTPVDGLLSYKGRQVVLYIKDHGGRVGVALDAPEKGNKFHVADCITLEQMRERGRYERYVVTNSVTGEFVINGRDWKTKEMMEGEVPLHVCKNCLKQLNYHGSRVPLTLNSVVEKFDVGEFFATYSSHFKHLPSRRAGEKRGSDYSADWDAISRSVRAEKEFKCRKCGVVLGSQPRLLHVHHRNGVKDDNRPLNLQVLCVSCHGKEPHHGHMCVSHRDQQVIARLRREQGLVNCDEWSHVQNLADPAVHGLILEVQPRGVALPEVGYTIQSGSGQVIGLLELAWPDARVGIAIGVDDRMVGEKAGWLIWSTQQALDAPDEFADLVSVGRLL